MNDVRDFSVAVQVNLGLQQTLELLKEGLQRQGLQIISEVRLAGEGSTAACLVIWGPTNACDSVISDPEARVFMPFNITVTPNLNGTMVAVTNPGMYARIWARILARELVRVVRQILILVEVPTAAGKPIPALAENQSPSRIPNCEVLTSSLIEEA